MFLFIFDNEKTFVRHFVVGVYIPQNSDLIPDDFSPLSSLCPNGRPVRRTMKTHQGVISELHDPTRSQSPASVNADRIVGKVTIGSYLF